MVPGRLEDYLDLYLNILRIHPVVSSSISSALYQIVKIILILNLGYLTIPV